MAPRPIGPHYLRAQAIHDTWCPLRVFLGENPMRQLRPLLDRASGLSVQRNRVSIKLPHRLLSDPYWSLLLTAMRGQPVPPEYDLVPYLVSGRLYRARLLEAVAEQHSVWGLDVELTPDELVISLGRMPSLHRAPLLLDAALALIEDPAGLPDMGFSYAKTRMGGLYGEYRLLDNAEQVERAIRGLARWFADVKVPHHLVWGVHRAHVFGAITVVQRQLETFDGVCFLEEDVVEISQPDRLRRSAFFSGLFGDDVGKRLQPRGPFRLLRLAVAAHVPHMIDLDGRVRFDHAHPWEDAVRGWRGVSSVKLAAELIFWAELYAALRKPADPDIWVWLDGRMTPVSLGYDVHSRLRRDGVDAAIALCRISELNGDPCSAITLEAYR